jgi:hypothetical protein
MDAKPFTSPQTMESIVTTAFNLEAQSGHSGSPQSAKLIAIVVLGLGLAGILALVGISFLALAVALPVALSLAGTYGEYISDADVALASQLTAWTPAFVAAAVASVVGSLYTIVKLIQRIDRAPAA